LVDAARDFTVENAGPTAFQSPADLLRQSFECVKEAKSAELVVFGKRELVSLLNAAKQPTILNCTTPCFSKTADTSFLGSQYLPCRLFADSIYSRRQMPPLRFAAFFGNWRHIWRLRIILVHWGKLP